MAQVGNTDISISTKTVCDKDRVDFWFEHVSQLLIRVECSSKQSEGIDATLVHKDFALFRASEIAANQHAVVRTAHSIRDDGRDSREDEEMVRVAALCDGPLLDVAVESPRFRECVAVRINPLGRRRGQVTPVVR